MGKIKKVHLFSRKIPRGIIYHTLIQSLGYLVRSIFLPLDDRNRILKFESAFAEYCERRYCVAFSFARTAIYFVLKSLDLPKGSEVILPPITIKGIVDVVVELGLVPRYVELDPETICFCMDDLRTKVGPATKAVIVTPLFGLVPSMDAMMCLFKQHGIFVIEDFSQCLNGRFNGKRIGTFGDVGIYSSSSIKTLDTLGGGLAVTNNEQLHEALRTAQLSVQAPRRKFLVKKAWLNLVRNVATTQPWFSLLTFPALQYIRSRDPDAALKQTGHRDKSRLTKLPTPWFCRYTSVQARIGLENLSKVATDDAARIANAEFVKAHSQSEYFPATTPYSGNVYWQLVLLSMDSVAAQSFFASRGVDIATSSLELVCALKNYPNCEELPMAECIYRNGIFVPCYPEMSRADLEKVSITVRDFNDAYDGS